MYGGDTNCPFCEGSLRASLAPLAIALLGLSLGCGPAKDDGSVADATSATSSDMQGSSTTSDGSASTTASDPSTSSSTTFDGQTETGDDVQTTSVSSGFIYGDPDGGTVTIECSVWDQDCAEDEKCMPWANDGGPEWNATRCTPLDPDAGEVGDPCTTEGSPVSGIDTCTVRAVCVVENEETLEGTCVEVCSGASEAPICMTEGTTCTNPETVAPLCL